MADMNRRSFMGAAAVAPIVGAQMAENISGEFVGGDPTLGVLKSVGKRAIPTLGERLMERAHQNVDYGGSRGVSPGLYGGGPNYTPGTSLKSCALWFQHRVDRQIIERREHEERLESLKVRYVPGYREAQVAKEFARLLEEHMALGFSESAEDQMELHDTNIEPSREARF